MDVLAALWRGFFVSEAVDLHLNIRARACTYRRGSGHCDGAIMSTCASAALDMTMPSREAEIGLGVLSELHRIVGAACWRLFCLSARTATSSPDWAIFARLRIPTPAIK